MVSFTWKYDEREVFKKVIKCQIWVFHAKKKKRQLFSLGRNIWIGCKLRFENRREVYFNCISFRDV